MRGQRAVQLVQLFAAGGRYVDGDAQIVAAFAFAQLQRFGIKSWIKFVRDEGDGVDEPVHFCAHNLDGEGAGVDDQGFFDHWRSGNSGLVCFGGVHATIIALQWRLCFGASQIAVIHQWLKRQNLPFSRSMLGVQWPNRVAAGLAAHR